MSDSWTLLRTGLIWTVLAFYCKPVEDTLKRALESFAFETVSSFEQVRYGNISFICSVNEFSNTNSLGMRIGSIKSFKVCLV